MLNRLIVILSGLLFSGCHYGKASDYFDQDMVELISAIEYQDQSKAQRYIAQGLDLNIHGQEGITPLIWLVMKKDKAAIRLALELGADPNFPAGDGGSLVAIVAGGNDSELLQLLLDKGGDPDSVDHNGELALFPVVAYARKDQLDLMLAAGADINRTDKTNATPLIYAGDLLKFDMVCLLLKNGADHTVRDSTDGDIAWSVHEAIEEKLVQPGSEQYEWLLKAKAFLINRGVAFPPLSPDQVRIKEGRLNPWDLDAIRTGSD